jgi:glycosyltransferase involved in cell wall biosynthesis
MKVALLTEYDHKKTTVTLFCPIGPISKAAIELGIPVREICIPLRKSWYFFLPIPLVDFSLLRELGEFDIIHIYSLNLLPNIFPLRKKNVIWTTHGYWEKPFGFRARVINLFVKHVIAVSADVFRIAEFNHQKKTCIPLGTKLGSPPEDNHAFNPLRITIACVGRFQRIKGQDLLLEALRNLAVIQPNIFFKLLLVGDVNGSTKEDIEFKASLKALAAKIICDKLLISFEGFQKEVTNYYDEADLIVIPSRYESFSMVAIEALARGKPVIGPDIGGPKEILSDPAAGILFEAGNAAALCRSILSAISKYDTFSPSVALTIASKYSVTTQASSHIRLYNSLIGEPPPVRDFK